MGVTSHALASKYRTDSRRMKLIVFSLCAGVDAQVGSTKTGMAKK